MPEYGLGGGPYGVCAQDLRNRHGGPSDQSGRGEQRIGDLVPTREPEIPNRVRELNKVAEELSQTVGNLYERLRPAMPSSSEESCKSNARLECSKRESVTELGSALEDNIVQIQHSIRLLEYMVSIVEL